MALVESLQTSSTVLLPITLQLVVDVCLDVVEGVTAEVVRLPTLPPGLPLL